MIPVGVYKKPVALLILLLGVTQGNGQPVNPAQQTAAYKPSGSATDTTFYETGSQGQASHVSLSTDFRQSAACIGSVLTSPLRWNRTDLIRAGGITLATAGSLLMDNTVRDLMRRNQSQFNEEMAEVGHSYSTVLYAGPSALALYATGAVLKNPWMKETGQMLTEAIVTAGIIQVPLSMAIGRARPFLDEGNASIRYLAGTDNDRASFFSGHSTVAFAVSTILSKQIDNTWATVGLYALAGLGPYSRLHDDKHWFSDTIIGSAVGYFVAVSVWNWHHGDGSETESKLSILPSGEGVSLRWGL